MKPNAHFVICDIDCVISDDAWRIPYIDWEATDPYSRYDHYHQLAAFDQLCNREILHTAPPEGVVLFTAMPENYRPLREAWLRHHRVAYLKMYMRPTQCHLPSEDLKEKMLFHLFKDYAINNLNILCAYDDRQPVIEMYRSYDVEAKLVRIHEVSAYHPVQP
jgi:hypothetical protein